MADQNVLIKAVLHCGYNGRGWSETYFLPQTTFAGAKPHGERIAEWRANCLAPGGVLKWARLSFVDTPRHTVALIGRPLKPRAYHGVQATPLNTVEVALQFRFETSDGRWGNRLVRGVGDDVIHNQEAVPEQTFHMQAWPDNLAMPDINDIGVPASFIFRAFLRVLKEETRYALKGPGPVAVWNVLEWNRVVYRGVTKRDTGREFGLGRGRRAKRAVVVPG